MTDQELVLRIKAYNAGDIANGLQAWKCKRCTRGGTASSTGTPTPRTSVAPVNQPQTRTASQSPSLRNPSSSEPHRTIPHPPSISQASTSRATPAYVGPTDSLRIRSHEGENSDSSRRTSSKPTGNTDAKYIRAPTTTVIERPAVVTAIKSTARTSKAAHRLPQEEQSADFSQKLLSTRHHPQSTSGQSTIWTQFNQRPIHAVTEDSDNILPSHRSPPRKKLASKNPIMKETQTTTNPAQASSQQEKETRREQFRRSAAEKEKRRRLEHRRLQQQILQAKIEEKESVEEITSEVVDLTLNTISQAQTQEPPPVHPDRLVPGTVDQTETLHTAGTAVPVVASASGVPEKEPHKEPDLAPQWIHARVSDDDMWTNALKKKVSETPPSATRRKIKAQKLGAVRPQLYQFDVIQWVDGSKRNRR